MGRGRSKHTFEIVRRPCITIHIGRAIRIIVRTYHAAYISVPKLGRCLSSIQCFQAIIKSNDGAARSRINNQVTAFPAPKSWCDTKTILRSASGSVADLIILAGRAVVKGNLRKIGFDRPQYLRRIRWHKEEMKIALGHLPVVTAPLAAAQENRSAPLFRYSRKFLARAAHYRSLALAEPDARRAETLFEISALFLEMSTNMAGRATANSHSLEKRRAEGVPTSGRRGQHS